MFWWVFDRSTSRELFDVLSGLAKLSVVSADVVSVAPAYDYAEITLLATAIVTYELNSLISTQFQVRKGIIRQQRNIPRL